MSSADSLAPVLHPSKEDNRSALLRMISNQISNSDRVIRLIRLFSQSFENPQHLVPQNTTPDEWRKSFSMLVRFTDSVVVTFVMIAYDGYRLLRWIGRPWIRMRRRVTKPAKVSRFRQTLRDFALPMMDRLLLVFLRKSKERTKVLVALIFFRGRLFLNLGSYPQALDCLEAAMVWGSKKNNLGFLFYLQNASAVWVAAHDQGLPTASYPIP